MGLLDLAITLGLFFSHGVGLPDAGQACGYTPSAFQAGSPWPKLQGNALNNGCGIGGGSNGSLRWSVPIPVTGASPVVGADGTIYVPTTGLLEAVNPADGSKIWSYPTGSLPGVVSTPAIGTGGTIYVAGNGAPLLLAIGADGKEIWQFSGLADGGVYLPTGAPTIAADGTIYVAGEEFQSSSGGINQNYLFALNPNGSVKWNFAAGQANAIVSTPALGSDGTLYFGASNQDGTSVAGAFYALNPSNGNLIWSFTTTGQITSAAAIGPDGAVYVGEQGGTKNLYAISPDGIAKVLFSGNSSIAWPPAVASDSSLYFPESDGSYYALNPDGSIKWSLPQGSCTAEPTVIGSDGTIYYGTRDGRLVAAFQQGTPIWSYTGQFPVLSSLAVGEDGTLYFGDSNGNLSAVGTEVDTIPVVGLTLAPTTVVGGTISTGTVTLQSSAPKGGALVHLTSNDPAVAVPPFTTIAPGATQSSFYIGTTASTSGTSAMIAATSGGATVGAGLTVQGATLSGLSISPSSVVAPQGAIGVVTLSAPAPAGGIAIQLSSTSHAISFPSSISVSAGSSTASFSIAAKPVVSMTACPITASQGTVVVTSSITIDPPTPTGLTVSPTAVLGGSSATGTITLSGQAGPNGQPVSLFSNNPSATVPASVTVPAGASQTTFAVSTVAVTTSTVATIKAEVGTVSVGATLTMNPTVVSMLALTPTSVIGGGKVGGTVRLSAPAPASGFEVALASSLSTVAKLPSSVKVLSGQSNAQFSIETTKVSSPTEVTVTATLNGNSQTAILTIDPPPIIRLTFSPTSVLGGRTATGTVGIQSSAPAGGVVVLLSSSSSAVVVPASVTVGAGRTSATFKAATLAVAAKTVATITGFVGPSSKSATLTVMPATLTSLSINPTRIRGGSSATGAVTISGPAPAGGVTVQLSAGRSVVTVPASVTVSGGQTKATFVVATSKVTAQTSVTVSATLGSVTKKTGLAITR